MGPRDLLSSWTFAWAVAVGIHVAVAAIRVHPYDDAEEQELVEFELAELPARPPPKPEPELPPTPPTPAPPETKAPPGPKNPDPNADPNRTSLESNRPATGPADEPVPIVTGLPLDPTQLAEGGMGVRVGNTFAPGYDADVAPGEIRGFVGGGAGGGDGTTSIGAAVATPDTPPKLLRAWQPPYPPDLTAQGIEGRVVLQVEVLTNGRAGKVTLIQGVHPDLDRIAMLAMERFRWQPARSKGGKIVATTQLAIVFRIND
ncbi:MAG: TonB family protein [Alphaproteobacteria bacterium]|nr:TonB family protein [Alphaproteobacteria bacterium]MCB9698038.1 TonB family protein [Alphaproteobacteria bacterium]